MENRTKSTANSIRIKLSQLSQESSVNIDGYEVIMYPDASCLGCIMNSDGAIGKTLSIEDRLSICAGAKCGECRYVAVSSLVPSNVEAIKNAVYDIYVAGMIDSGSAYKAREEVLIFMKGSGMTHEFTITDGDGAEVWISVKLTGGRIGILSANSEFDHAAAVKLCKKKLYPLLSEERFL